MNRPEYWEDDETWAAYEEFERQRLVSSPPATFASPLKQAIDSARDVDIHASIRFLNEVIRLYRGGT